MSMKPVRTGSRTRVGLNSIGSILLLSGLAIPWSDGRAVGSTYSIDYHIISSGGNSMANSCFHLQGTVAQTAPGYSSGSIYTVTAGFWPAASLTAGSDAIFFNGFEGC